MNYPVRAVMLVDGSNLYASLKNLNLRVDYGRFRNFFPGLFRAMYFTAMPDDNQDSLIRPTLDWMSYNGWVMETKPTRSFVDNVTGEVRVKGNMDVEITLAGVSFADTDITDIILVTGDGDFRQLVEHIQRKGKRVTVVSTCKTNPSMVADTMRRQADIFIDLDDIRDSIRKQSEFEKSEEEFLQRKKSLNFFKS